MTTVKRRRQSAALIRPAGLEDAPEVARLSAAFAAYLTSLGDDCPGPLTEAGYRRDGFGPRRHFCGLVAELKGRLAGYLLYHSGYDVDRCAPVTYIIDLFVDPAARRHGLGRRLMAEAAKAARGVGSVELIWGVYRPNRLAYAFYEALGAEHITNISLMRLPVERAL